MARPRTATRRIASSAVSTPAMTPAASSPTLCPAAASAGTSVPEKPEKPETPETPETPERAEAATIAAATSSGCATAVSLISSALAVVPNLTRSQPASSETAPRRSATPGSSSQGARKPGVCAPCPGAVMISILLPCPVDLRQMNVEQYEVTRRIFVGYLQLALTRGRPSLCWPGGTTPPKAP